MRRLIAAMPGAAAGRRRFLLGLDFDGTLAPLARVPGLAKLPPRTRELLRRLSRLERVRVAIVTGRALADIKRKVGLTGLIYVGNHGLEIQEVGKPVWVHPQARRSAALMRRLASRLRAEIGVFPGCMIEDKGLTLSVHYRGLPRYLSPRPLRELLKRLVEGQGHLVRVGAGKKVWEIRPRLTWNKGYAMRRLLGPGAEAWIPVLVGDDATDEEGFRSLGPSALTVRVGYKKDSRARFRLRGQKHVAPMLEHFLRSWR